MNPLSAAIDAQQRGLAATSEYLEKLPKLAEQLERVGDIEVGMTPSEVVYEENKLQLLHYTPEMAGIEPETTHDVPILIVYALINKPYILDLQPDRSVVRRLLEAGFEVYLIDWGEPSRLDAHLTLADYVTRYTDNCVDVVRERSGQESINLLGYCMGGTMSVMYAALFPEKVRNLGLMAAGLCFDDTGGVLELWGEEEFYDPEKVTDTFGNVPADYLDIGFAMMDPISNYVTKYLRLYDNLEDDEFVKNFARMERWLGEGIDVAGKTYQQFIEDIYQDNKLARNEFHLGETHVDLADIEMPIVQVVGHYDHLIPPESSTEFNDLVPSDDVTTFDAQTGHIGLSVSSSSHDELWPTVADWFAERSQPDDEPAAEPDGDVDTKYDVDAESNFDAESNSDAESDEIDEPEPEVDEGLEVETETEIHDNDTDVAIDQDAEVKTDATVDTEADTDESTFARESEQLESVYGIGPYYAEQLREAGVESIEALATAEADAVADSLGVSSDRVEEWIESARDH